jgi:hypothetical protein
MLAFKRFFILFFGVGKKIKRVIYKEQSRHKDVEETGQWYFKRDILDRIDQYFVYIQRMKKADREAYDMYSKVGATILSPKGMVAEGIPAEFKSGIRPTFGASAFLGTGDSKEENEKYTFMKFAYFKKLTANTADIEPFFGGPIYQLTVFLSDSVEDKGNLGFSLWSYVGVYPDGRIKVLRYVEATHQKIIHKDRQGGTSTIHRMGWTYGLNLDRELTTSTNKERERWNSLSIQGRAEVIFGITLSGYIWSSGALRVSVAKKNIKAVFCIDLLRTPYFFDEREPVYADKGHKKRIFHIVRTHKRTYKDGKETYVHSHFRGLRRFNWHGYEILITMPGTHHTPIIDFDAELHVVGEDEPTWPGYMEESEAIKKIANHLNK